MPPVPIRCRLIRMRNTQDPVVGKQIPDDRRAYRLRNVSLAAEVVRYDYSRMAGLVRQPHLARAGHEHVEIFHRLCHLLHQNPTAALRLDVIQSENLSATAEATAPAPSALRRRILRVLETPQLLRQAEHRDAALSWWQRLVRWLYLTILPESDGAFAYRREAQTRRILQAQIEKTALGKG